jgi:hypothetical protein
MFVLCVRKMLPETKDRSRILWISSKFGIRSEVVLVFLRHSCAIHPMNARRQIRLVVRSYISGKIARRLVNNAQSERNIETDERARTNGEQGVPETKRIEQCHLL